MKAVFYYGEAVGAKFETYAAYWAVEAMRKACYNCHRVVRRPNRGATQSLKTKARYYAVEIPIDLLDCDLSLVDLVGQSLVASDDPVENVMKREECALVRDSLRFLSPFQRTVLWRYCVDGVSLRSLADEFGTTFQNVHGHVQRILGYLARRLRSLSD